MAESFCPVCAEQTAEQILQVDDLDQVEVHCRKCMRVRISGPAQAALQAGMDVDRRVLSGVARYEAQNGNILLITSENINELIRSAPRPKSPLQAIDNLVLWIGDRSDGLSSRVPLEYHAPPITVALDTKEFMYIVGAVGDFGYAGEVSSTWINLNIKGWQRYIELRESRPDSRQGFAAMWFADDLTPAWTEGIRPALEDAGYTAVRLDAVEHNEKIDDRIIAEIRRSGLVVADMTGGRANVYFEAGFAMGLGIPIIWTCHKDDVDQLHFDTRQYNYIAWTTPVDLRDRLRARVEANFPLKAEARR